MYAKTAEVGMLKQPTYVRKNSRSRYTKNSRSIYVLSSKVALSFRSKKTATAYILHEPNKQNTNEGMCFKICDEQPKYVYKNSRSMYTKTTKVCILKQPKYVY